MNAVAVFRSHSALQFPSFLSFSGQPSLGGKPISLKEIADGPLLFDSQKVFPRLTVLSIRSDGHKRHGPPRRSSDSRRRKEDENETPQSSDGKKSKSSNQEEIIALFRRIQSSISKGESLSTKKRNSNLSEDKPSPESILDVLRKSRKQAKDKEGDKVLIRRRGVPQKEQAVQNSQQVADLKSTRPPSEFVKRSPIPSPSTPRGKILELNGEALAARDGSKELNLPGIEGMKLTELKEVAKSRGMKGYSKLKKSELVELLRS
ncbi:SAP-like protein BP-73 isoform X2 [Corylus avellana]|uniref:SAP-like protein BP-73 isoform X2 n=1 Tax=Corylus avellana TaxID=13451 RepID=UPI00286BFE80|nr:SAP-like protein BP-73 isoform X2 [Corylus avellana]